MEREIRQPPVIGPVTPATGSRKPRGDRRPRPHPRNDDGQPPQRSPGPDPRRRVDEYA